MCCRRCCALALGNSRWAPAMDALGSATAWGRCARCGDLVSCDKYSWMDGVHNKKRSAAKMVARKSSSDEEDNQVDSRRRGHSGWVSFSFTPWLHPVSQGADSKLTWMIIWACGKYTAMMMKFRFMMIMMMIVLVHDDGDDGDDDGDDDGCFQL